MKNDNLAELSVLDTAYFVEIGLIILVGTALWIAVGTIAGYEVLDIHEWGMYWLIAVPFVVPVVVVISIVIAAIVPPLAAGKGYERPQWLGKVVACLWFLIAFIVTLAILVAAA